MSFAPYDTDDALLEQARASGRSQVKVYCPAETLVVLGRGSRAEVELDLDSCARDGVKILRRRGGGCAVVLDPGNVIVSRVLAVEGIGDNTRHLHELSRWLICGLEAVGVRDLERVGVSDLVQRGRKVSGSCIYRPRGLLYYSATLLIDADLTLMRRYLRHPPREPDYRRARAHQDFVARLETPAKLGGAPAVAAALRETLQPR